MWTKNKKAVSEVNRILKQLDENSLQKIPKKLLNEIEKNATVNVDYIKVDIALEDLNLEQETKEMLAVISYQYFCDEEEREIWNQELEENERKYQEELREKYNPEDIFKKVEVKNDEENVLVEYREPFFRKIWDRIRKFFHQK